MRKKLSIIALLVLFLVVIISTYLISSVGGRDPRANNYPFQISSWICEGPEMFLQYGAGYEGEYTLWDQAAGIGYLISSKCCIPIGLILSFFD